MISAHEKAALAACGAALAAVVEPSQELSTFWPPELIEEANYALRARGLRITRQLPFQRWLVVSQ